MIKCTLKLMQEKNLFNKYAQKQMVGQEYEDFEDLYDNYTDFRIEDELKDNCTCDISGICSGISCKYYDKCNVGRE